jgi:hypothetical protein
MLRLNIRKLPDSYPLNPLIKESLNVNKKMHDEGKYSWYTCVNNIFKEFDLDIEHYSNIDEQQFMLIRLINLTI